MDEGGSSPFHHRCCGSLSGFEGGLAEGDFSPMAANSFDLDARGGIWHHDVSGNATLLGCERDCLGVIPTRMCADAAFCFFTKECYCIARSAEFEGADMLQILALEEEAPPGH
jgi:hypothetical protein